MRAMRGWAAAGLAAVVALAGCGGGDGDGLHAAPAGGTAAAQAPRPAAATPTPPAVRLATAADSAREQAHVAQMRAQVEAAFARGTRIGASEIGQLRADKNARHVATASRMGIRAGRFSAVPQLVRDGRLVALGDSTAFWVLRDMDHSVPYVTPDAKAMLQELGRRFQARLRALGLPAYRMKVTSALRTDESQADLRKINSYAARTVSSHEFGTTMDVSHERFAVPADPRSEESDDLRMERAMLEEVGKANAKVMQAELGRAILEMRKEGLLLVIMENKQPVYHMTVAHSFPH
jgi:hypothetical protein